MMARGQLWTPRRVPAPYELPGADDVADARVDADMPSDRLLTLSTYRRTLRHFEFPTRESVLTATPKHLADLGDHRADILKLCKAGDPDVMAALFTPNDDNAELWSVAMVDRISPTQRLLTFQFSCDDTEAERALWAALKVVLAARP
jgi:hypothetical protein